MARHEQPLERDGSPLQELAYWLRDLRNQSGMKVAQLKRQTGFSSSTLYGAFGGKQLPSQQVTLAIVKACGGNVEAWRSYWAQIRRLLDLDAPRGIDRSVIPPWVSQAARPADSGANGQLSTSQDGGVIKDSNHLPDPEMTPPLTGREAAGGPRTGWRRQRHGLLMAATGLVVVAAVATVTVLLVGHRDHPATGSSPHSSLAVVIVQNKDAIGSSSLLEDSTPAYLSTQPIPRCRLRGCEIKGTDMWSGADLVVSCWVRGAEMTNEDTTSAGIANNPNGVTSTLWYRGIWPDGRNGYLSEVYVKANYRGGLGLPTCNPSQS